MLKTNLIGTIVFLKDGTEFRIRSVQEIGPKEELYVTLESEASVLLPGVRMQGLRIKRESQNSLRSREVGFRGNPIKLDSG